MFILILLLIRQWVEIPVYLLLAMIGLSVGKDILLFPFLWRYYDPSHLPDRFGMVGRRGHVLTRLNPRGIVQIRGERWQAEVAPDQAPVDAGETVWVEAINGLRLTVSRFGH
jgi:membrane-bound ClpP family serine protease